MVLPDVNVLIYAHRSDMAEHDVYAAWLSEVADGPKAFACSDLILSAVVRIVTNPRVYATPTPLQDALAFCANVRTRPQCVMVSPGPRHWAIFEHLCLASRARGKLVADAWHAALAIEHGCDFITADADFARFPGLRWRHPLAH